ncbi:Hpt domain-containing protein [Paraglaciecola arctica]|uniref:Hpt domain-containing protein n=1 Tax=Paraglaciecola arctica TaxID=1128911 RepID=UPI001C072203|nr:Hpt domain-containing protein [Paraglaciecola arctica]MBU3003336.1 Hpt domain-containing protein [Paraglaciecola arctica]
MTGSDTDIFDTQFAMNQFSGNQSLLVKILDKFIKQYQHFDTLLKDSIHQQDYSAAKLEVHTVKGVSGNIGLKALHIACKEFEGDLANQTTEHSLDKFLNVLEQTLTLVKNYSAENNGEATADVEPEQDDKAILIAALKRSEFISDSKMKNFGPSLNLSAEKLEELKLAIDNLDYDRALQLLE